MGGMDWIGVTQVMDGQRDLLEALMRYTILKPTKCAVIILDDYNFICSFVWV
jgi:hypothetical protein